MRSARMLATTAVMALVAGLTTIGPPTALAQQPGPDPSAAAEQDLRRQSDGTVTVTRDERGIVHFVGTETGKPARRPGEVPANASAERKAAAHVARYRALWALDRRGTAARVARSHPGSSGQSVVRFEQTVEGMPVFAGELAVAVDGAGNLQSVVGETTPLALKHGDRTITADAARETARRATARARRVPLSSLRASEAKAFAYDAALIGPQTRTELVPVWRIEVTGPADVRQLVLVDRIRGGVALQFNQVAGLNRVVCDRADQRDTSDADGYPTLAPCTTSGASRDEGQAAVAEPDVNLAYDYVGHTSDFFAGLGVDLTALMGTAGSDGTKLRSTVRYCLPADYDPQCPMRNAFYNGDGIYFGSGFARADDVIAHELVHGVTEKLSGLAYWYQSGAINESMSDVFGELVDLTNGHDVGTTRPWLLGEDSPVGPVRSMADPTVYGDPDRMTSGHYDAATWTDQDFDNGGVHGNSGVGNKAAYLIAEPGTRTFNGRTVTGLGYDKTARIYHRALTTLTSGADYLDLYYALPQACADLAGSAAAGITSSDCVSVSQAVLATEMNKQPTSADAKAPEAHFGCTADRRRTVFAEDFEGTEDELNNRWARTTGMWHHSTSYAKSGDKSLYGWEPDRTAGEPANTFARLKTKLRIPAGVKSYLRFDHQFLLAYWPGDAEYPQRQYYAGGRLEYTVDGKAWKSAMGLPWHSTGTTPRTITPYYSNGSAGTPYQGFGGDSHGYTSSRVDLSSLAGKVVQLRWRITGDPEFHLDGWTLDNINLYACGGATPSEPRLVSGRGGLRKAIVLWKEPLWPGDGGVTKYRITASPGGKVVDNIPADATSAVVTGLGYGTTYTFTVEAFSAAGDGPGSTKRLIGTKATVPTAYTDYSMGGEATVKGVLKRVDTGKGVAGQSVRVQVRDKGATSWTTIASPTTNSSGVYSATLPAERDMEYRIVYYSGNWAYMGMVSSVGKIAVRQDVQLLGPNSIYRGRTATFTTTVYPEKPGGKVYFQRYYNSKWNTVQSRTLNADGYAVFQVTHSSPGKYKYRVFTPSTSTHTAGYSPVHTLTVT